MAQNAGNVAAFSPKVDGGISFAPLGTPLPTDASTALDPAFISLGYISVDGVTPANDESATDTIRAWGGDAVLELTTEKSISRYEFTLIEVFAEAVNGFVFGETNVTVTQPTSGAGTKVAVADQGDDPADCVLVIDMIYKSKPARIVIGHAQNRITGGNALVHTAEAGWSVQSTCTLDDSGKRQYLYFENDDATA